MDKRQRFPRLAMAAAGGLAVILAASLLPRHFPERGSGTALAQASPPQSILEREEFLFVQNPRGEGVTEGIYVMWIPQPAQKYCLGRSSQQCIDIDSCIRTTNRQSSRCKNLSVSAAQLPSYPSGIIPRRVLGVIYFPAAPIKGLGTLFKYFESKPRGMFDQLSAGTRIKAKIRLTRSADDDQFELLEVLQAPPL